MCVEVVWHNSALNVSDLYDLGVEPEKGSVTTPSLRPELLSLIYDVDNLRLRHHDSRRSRSEGPVDRQNLSVMELRSQSSRSRSSSSSETGKRLLCRRDETRTISPLPKKREPTFKEQFEAAAIEEFDSFDDEDVEVTIDSYDRKLIVSQGESLPLSPSAFQVTSPLPSPSPSPFPGSSLSAAGDSRDSPIVMDEIAITSVEWVKYHFKNGMAALHDTALESIEPGRQISDDVGDRGIQLILGSGLY